MSHELRTPLNSIEAFSKLTLEELSSPSASSMSTVAEYIRSVLTSASALLGVINQILECEPFPFASPPPAALLCLSAALLASCIDMDLYGLCLHG